MILSFQEYRKYKKDYIELMQKIFIKLLYNPVFSKYLIDNNIINQEILSYFKEHKETKKYFNKSTEVTIDKTPIKILIADNKVK